MGVVGESQLGQVSPYQCITDRAILQAWSKWTRRDKHSFSATHSVLSSFYQIFTLTLRVCSISQKGGMGSVGLHLNMHKFNLGCKAFILCLFFLISIKMLS